MVIYRKYRPQTFSEVIGQENIIKILENEIKQGKIAHAYLFTGPRGLGKTTVSRLMAKSINCLKRKPNQSEPCNTCQNCKDIVSNRFLDLIELDAASHTGVDNVRENIISYSRIPPIAGKYKVFAIDEAHMLRGTNAVCKFVESMPLIRFSFTGTLPEDTMDRWNVIGISEPLLKVTKAKELQEAGYIANIDIVALYLKHGVPQPHKPASEVLEEHPEYRGNSEKIALEIAKARFPLEWRYIEDSDKANNFICRLALKLIGNNIILFDHIAHGKVIQEKLEGMTDRPVFFIDGSVKLEDREDICDAMETQNGCILIANTKAFGTGTNVKAINNIIFGFSSGNAYTKIIQGIGRGLRVKDGKTKMTLYDVYHSFRYSTEHYEKRKGLYKDNYEINSFKKITVNL